MAFKLLGLKPIHSGDIKTVIAQATDQIGRKLGIHGIMHILIGLLTHGLRIFIPMHASSDHALSIADRLAIINSDGGHIGHAEEFELIIAADNQDINGRLFQQIAHMIHRCLRGMITFGHALRRHHGL